MPRPNHIGFNLLDQVPRFAGGIGTYSRELISALIARRPDLRLTGFMNAALYEAQGDEPWPAGLDTVRIPVDPAHRVRRVLAEQVLLPRLVRKRGVDLLHSTGNSGPVWLSVPHVLTLHDLIWVHHPETMARITTMSLKVLIPPIARHADRIITDSEAARGNIVSVLGIDPELVDVVYMGFGVSRASAGTPEDELRRKLELGDAPMILHVSGKRRHKNLIHLIEAFSRLECEPKPILVLPGPGEAQYERQLRERAVQLNVSERVMLLGWLDQADLEGLYEASTCFVFPSLIEGFGLPVLEAMHRSLPVALSNAPPLPEVGGDAARYFDPYDVSDIATAIEELLSDADERKRLIAAGKARADEFTWERTAEQTLAVYERVLNDT